ncbi:DNA-binding protein [Catellatospora citrea]|uniref:helix-turn-helix transcriptional regulator n=1 Tax=Catellatospora citrea TaxID=53366 RepID=UPI0033F6EFB1
MTLPADIWTAERIRALGVITDLLTAAKILNIGRTRAYQMARAGTFPVPITTGARKYAVRVVDLLHHLHLATEHPLDHPAVPSVHGTPPDKRGPTS